MPAASIAAQLIHGERMNERALESLETVALKGEVMGVDVGKRGGERSESYHGGNCKI